MSNRRKPTGPAVARFVPTYWNGKPTPAQRGTAVVADAPEFPKYWAREDGLIGKRINVVRVNLDGVNRGGGEAYLDDREDLGWMKVTVGRGGPRYGHADVAIEDGSFRPHGRLGLFQRRGAR